MLLDVQGRLKGLFGGSKRRSATPQYPLSMKLRFVIGGRQHSALFFLPFPDWRLKGPAANGSFAGPFRNIAFLIRRKMTSPGDPVLTPVGPPDRDQQEAARYRQCFGGNVYSAASCAVDDDRRNPRRSSVVITSANRHTILLRVALCSASVFVALASAMKMTL
jgi:hypothetical protein